MKEVFKNYKHYAEWLIANWERSPLMDNAIIEEGLVIERSFNANGEPYRSLTKTEFQNKESNNGLVQIPYVANDIEPFKERVHCIRILYILDKYLEGSVDNLNKCAVDIAQLIKEQHIAKEHFRVQGVAALLEKSKPAPKEMRVKYYNDESEETELGTVVSQTSNSFVVIPDYNLNLKIKWSKLKCDIMPIGDDNIHSEIKVDDLFSFSNYLIENFDYSDNTSNGDIYKNKKTNKVYCKVDIFNEWDFKTTKRQNNLL